MRPAKTRRQQRTVSQENDLNTRRPPEAPAEVTVVVRSDFLKSLLGRVLRPIPGAQPRLRFEMPPEAVAEEAQEESGKFGVPGPRISAQHPIYLGFMGAVGIGLALFLYYVVTNTSQLLLWILAALFIAPGLDPVVRWLERRKIPRPVGIIISLAVLVGIIAAFFATLIPTVVDQTSQLVKNAPSGSRIS